MTIAILTVSRIRLVYLNYINYLQNYMWSECNIDTDILLNNITCLRFYSTEWANHHALLRILQNGYEDTIIFIFFSS